MARVMMLSMTARPSTRPAVVERRIAYGVHEAVRGLGETKTIVDWSGVVPEIVFQRVLVVGVAAGLFLG